MSVTETLLALALETKKRVNRQTAATGAAPTLRLRFPAISPIRYPEKFYKPVDLVSSVNSLHATLSKGEYYAGAGGMNHPILQYNQENLGLSHIFHFLPARSRPLFSIHFSRCNLLAETMKASTPLMRPLSSMVPSGRSDASSGSLL